jgi:hypothetical protein
MLTVHIVGLAIVGIGLALFAADQLIGRGRGQAGATIWHIQISGPPTLVLAVVGLLVFLFPYSPWWPADDAAPTVSPTVATTSGSPVTPTGGLVLPTAARVYNQPLADAEQALTEVGLVVEEADIGCSNSTLAGYVRQVTVGDTKNVGVIYGKASDSIDQDAIRSLGVGD